MGLRGPVAGTMGRTERCGDELGRPVPRVLQGAPIHSVAFVDK